MTKEEIDAEDAKLQRMANEVLHFHIQGGSATDHILAAEAYLELYERSFANFLADIKLVYGSTSGTEGEGTMSVFRLAGEMHIKIAEAISNSMVG